MRRAGSTRPRSRPTRRGVTLLEVTLAMGLLVVLSSMTYWFYSASLDTSRQGTEETRKLRLVRVVLNRIGTEIRQAALITADNRVGIRGEPERIWLSSYRVPRRAQSEVWRYRDEPPPGEYDLTKVEYKIVRHPEILHEDGYEFPLGLARIEILIPRPDSAESGEAFEEEGLVLGDEDETGADEGLDEGDPGDLEGGEENIEEVLPDEEFPEDEERGDVTLGLDINWEELYAPEVRHLRFCYFDGSKWWDSWDLSGESPLPQLVQVTLGFEPVPPVDAKFSFDNEINEEFCTCLNEDPVDCEPLAPDQFSTVVRVPQADPLFRSRVSRETQSLVEQVSGGAEE